MGKIIGYTVGLILLLTPACLWGTFGVPVVLLGIAYVAKCFM